MGVLDQVTRMKKQGIGDDQIIGELSQQGISPKEILTALKQSQIKEAVSSYGAMDEEMQPSVIQGGEGTIPQPESAQQQYYQEAPPMPNQEYNQQYAPQQYYQQAGEYQPYSEGNAAPADTDTIMEIADQIFSEKIKKIQKKVDDASEAAVLLQSKTENITERLKRMEGIIDKLQIAILEKIGSYGQNLESVKKEMSMMQESFSKVLSHKEQRESEKPEHKKRTSKK